MVTIYGLKTCDTCRAALGALSRAGRPAELVDIRATPLSPAQVAAFAAAFGDALVNRRSTTWRSLDDAARALPVAALLAAHPAVMKRPVIAAEGALYLGWGAEARAALA